MMSVIPAFFRSAAFSALLALLLAVQPVTALAQDDLSAPGTVQPYAERAQEIADDAQQGLADQAERVEEAVENFDADVNDAADSLPTTSSLTDDLKQARDIIMKNADNGGDNRFARGLIVAFLHPLFLASMFSLGLLAGQMSERLKHIWVLPVIMYVATMAGAFITTYHAEWKPQFDADHWKILAPLQSTEMVCVVIGVLVGVVVGFQLGLPVFLALIGAVGIGLTLGFSQISADSARSDSILPFWAGFGLSGLLINIFGIGFETFFQSINLKIVTRVIGIATAALALFLGAKLF